MRSRDRSGAPCNFAETAIYLGPQGLVILPSNLVEVHGGLRELQAHHIERVGDDGRDREVPEPLVVGRDDVPGRAMGARPVEDLLGRRPELALLVVGVDS
jgi:hypothetical protein